MKLWIDIETTGTDKIKDKILQIAAIITDDNLNIVEEYEWVVKHRTQEVYKMACEKVQVMHAETNLWGRLPYGKAIEEIDKELLEVIKKVNIGNKVNIGGNSVHFDFYFIQEHLKESGKLLHHRLIDISATLETLSLIGKDIILPDHYTTHNALDDIKWSIIQARTIKEQIGV